MRFIQSHKYINVYMKKSKTIYFFKGFNGNINILLVKELQFQQKQYLKFLLICMNKNIFFPL